MSSLAILVTLVMSGASAEATTEDIGAPVTAGSSSYDLGVSPSKKREFPLPNGIAGTLTFYAHDATGKTVTLSLTVPGQLRGKAPEGYNENEFGERYTMTERDSGTYWLKPADGLKNEFLTVDWDYVEKDGATHVVIVIDHWKVSR